jgi:hypothetical protein
VHRISNLELIGGEPVGWDGCGEPVLVVRLVYLSGGLRLVWVG